jgi:multiple antibiotic resistance protein
MCRKMSAISPLNTDRTMRLYADMKRKRCLYYVPVSYYFLPWTLVVNIPCFLVILKGINADRRNAITVYEVFIVLLIVILFMFTGQYILKLLQLSQSSLGIAGCIVLFLIAVKMIFSGSSEIFTNSTKGNLFIVPLAVPLVAESIII